MKIIVNKNWLPFRVGSSRRRNEIQGDIMGGVLVAPHGLSTEEHSYCLEKSLQVSGNPSRLFSLLADLPKGEGPLWEERNFLRGFSLSRLGRDREAGDCFASLPRSFEARVLTERALGLVNQGDFLAADSLFEAAQKAAGDGLDPFSACTLLGGWSLAAIQSGDFSRAEGCLRNRRQILREHSSPILAFGTNLYEILLLLERNDFQQAAERLSRALRGTSLQSVNGFFLNHLRLRLQIARNELTEAKETLDSLRGIQANLQLPDGVLDFRLEELEWLLRSRATETLGPRLADLEKAAAVKHDEFFRFRLALLGALATLLGGEPKQALERIRPAIENGEARGYRPGLTWAYFHAAGISIATGNTVLAKLYLMKGRRLSEQLGLRVRLAGFSYMTEVLESKYASASALLSLAKHQEIGPELEYLLNSYHLLQSVALSVWDGKTKDIVREADLRRMLFRSPGIFWFQKESVLLVHDGSRPVQAIDFPDDSALSTLFRLFWKDFQAGKVASLSLRDVHRVRIDAPYREELHNGAAKMLLSRLRQRLQGKGLEIIYLREKGLYGLNSELPGFTIHSQEGRGKEPRNREKEILERVSLETFVSTRTLCEEFQVSRQALHPILQRLCNEKKLRLVKRGPISGYMKRA